MTREKTDEILKRVSRHFSAPEWFTTLEFPIYHGVATPDGKDRAIDALAISRIAGRGNEVQAIEVKTERSDWLRELDTPHKAEAWTQLADRFWVAAAKGVVKVDELPAGWGFLEERGLGLRKVRPAALISNWRENGGTDPIPREIWVRVLRRTLEGEHRTALAAEYQRGHEDGVKARTEDTTLVLQDAQRDLRRLKDQVHDFEKASGLKIGGWNGRHLGEAVKVVIAHQDFLYDVGNAALNARNMVRGYQELIDALKAAGFDPEKE